MKRTAEVFPFYRSNARVTRALAAVAGVCGAVFLVGLFFAPERVWPGFLMGFVYLTGLGVAGLVFLSALNLANAGWATALRRVPEAMAGSLPWAGAVGLMLLFGIPTLYEWSHPGVLAEDPVLEAKSSWLNTGLFALRLVIVFVVWAGFARWFISRSRLQDREEAGSGSRRSHLVASALFMVAFTVTWSLASFDWLMSLEPHWFSTIYALYTLAGLGCAGLAAGIVLLLALRRHTGMRAYIREDHLHDLGKLLLAFTVFWVYIWYCQYMLIWYTDIPEETSWYLARKAGTWGSLTPVNLALNWLIPFVVLLPRAAKRSARVLERVAWVMLVGHALDLYILVGPPLMGDHPVFGPWELAPVVGAVALFFLLVRRGLSQAPLVPMQDPYLPESLAYHA